MTDYAKLKVTDLKILVKERGIAAAGLKIKQQLVAALEADDATNGQDTGGEQDAEDLADAPEVDAEQDAAAAAVEQVNVPEDNTEPAKDVETKGESSDATSTDTENMNKRKRRSPTPPLSEEVVNKKLKTAEEQDANEGTKVKLPEGIETARVNSEEQDQTDTIMQNAPDAGPPSVHPPTRSIYIRELVRPLQPNSLREHLLSVAQPKGADSEPVAIEAFHVDRRRSMALARFNTSQAALQARAMLHDTAWPDEPMRKPLWVDFIPDNRLQEWIDVEVGGGDRRWEVVYESAGSDTDGSVMASLQEADAAGTGAHKPSGLPARGTVGEGMPNAPSGPRRRSPPTQQPPTPPAAQSPKPDQNTFDTLESMYNFTQTKPKIYFLPVSSDLAQRRQANFDQETSRDWNDADADPSAYGEGELRRYTFEDGDRLVDGGADFGLFGRRGRGGGPPRGGRGRGRGGGGGGGGGDYYRGGGGYRWR